MSESEPPISLQQFAGVCAALAENLPLAGVLTQERIEEAAFREAEPAWRERIAGSVVTQLEYTEKLRVAQDCLARKLAPIEDDAAAWVGLLGAMATALDQGELLTKLGITMTDVGRLGREWKRRVQKDPELGKQLAELAGSAKPPEKVSAGPIELRPFPWTPKQKAPAAKEVAPELAEEPKDEQEAPQVKRVLASFQTADAAPAPEVAAQESSFAAWTIERYAHLAWELRSNPTEADAVMQRAGLMTPETRRLVHEHFRRRFDAEPGLRAQFDAWLAASGQAGSQARGTGTDELDTAELVRRRAPMPFHAAAEPKPDAQRRRDQRAADESLAKHGPDDAAVLARMKSAFQRARAPAATAHIDQAMLGRPLPFAQIEGALPGVGSMTVDMDGEPGPRAKPVLPFEAGALVITTEPMETKRQSGLTVASSAPLGWTLERYARLCVDLHSSGLAEARVLAGAHLSPPARQLLDAYWQPRLQAEPELRAEWQQHANQRAAELRRP